MTERRETTLLTTNVPLAVGGEVAAVQSPDVSGDRASINVRLLLNGAREAILVLDGEAYRLRITAKEKLILTK